MRDPRHRRTAVYDRFQSRPRMRVPSAARKHVLQIHVVRAIARDQVINDGLYCRSLEDLCQGDNSALFNNLAKWLAGAVSGELKDGEVDALAQVYSGLQLLENDDKEYPIIEEFNNRFLNGRGRHALFTLLIFDAARIDPVTIDTLRGGNALDAAYGPRKTRPQKKLGRQLQALLKQFAVVDEPAMTEAAERYVEYRFVDDGSFPDYKRRKELEGNPRSDSHLRKWFEKFDRALGFPSPPRGRPPKRPS